MAIDTLVSKLAGRSPGDYKLQASDYPLAWAHLLAWMCLARHDIGSGCCVGTSARAWQQKFVELASQAQLPDPEWHERLRVALSLAEASPWRRDFRDKAIFRLLPVQLYTGRHFLEFLHELVDHAKAWRALEAALAAKPAERSPCPAAPLPAWYEYVMTLDDFLDAVREAVAGGEQFRLGQRGQICREIPGLPGFCKHSVIDVVHVARFRNIDLNWVGAGHRLGLSRDDIGLIVRAEEGFDTPAEVRELRPRLLEACGLAQ